MLCDLRVSQFPRGYVPYRTLEDIFFLLRPSKHSEIAVSNEWHCVRDPVQHMLFGDIMIIIVMGNMEKVISYHQHIFFNCYLCTYSSLLCIFCMCIFGLVDRSNYSIQMSWWQTIIKSQSNMQLHIQEIWLNRSRKARGWSNSSTLLWNLKILSLIVLNPPYIDNWGNLIK